ncbi:MAG TPA: cupin domain-containing protein [Cyclobacteriaceae bacterium]|jgi:predicted cupin superfamily sugar epimerase
MHTADYWIEHLGLKPHPEGGFYRETYRAKEDIPAEGLPLRYRASRSFSTAIFFLLRSSDRSLFHRIKSDEIWHFYYGGRLALYQLSEPSSDVIYLGSHPDKGERLQAVVPAGTWFGAKVVDPDSYCLCGCTVAPGFDFGDFETARRSELLNAYPSQAEIIELLTLPDVSL